VTDAAADAAADSALLARVARRDRAAFAHLCQAYHRRILRFLGRFTRRQDVAEEVVNDTLYVVWCKAPEFRGESQVSTWIMGIAYRRALKSLQGLSAAVPPERPPAETVPGAAAPDPPYMQRQWLEAALAELPLEQRMVLELTYFLGHSCEEIASIMQCPVNTVKTRMFHARAKLRVRLPFLAGERP
jgi:RNA polymerase sigma-70 factor (ECF subfamily)